MSIQLITILSIAVLLIIFALGTAFNMNLGILGFVASLFMGYFLMDLPINTLLAGIPVSLFVILVGVTYFFNILRDNGTIDLIVACSLKLVRGYTALIPWVMYLLSYLLAGLGTQGTAVIVIVAPIALSLAYEYNIDQLMMSVMVAFGMFGGVYSPLNVNGIGAENMLLNYGVEFSFLTTNLSMFAFTTGLSLVFFCLLGGIKLFKQGRVDPSSLAGSNTESARLLSSTTKVTLFQILSLLGLAVLIFLGIYLKLNMGFSAMLIGCVLSFAAPNRQKDIINSIPWPVILMVCGIVCYIETLNTIGVMDYLEQAIQSFDNPKLTILIASYIGGFISAFCSTLGTLTSIIPMVSGVLDDPSIYTPSALACLCVASTIVDICPFSPTGALFVANAQGEAKTTLYKRLLITSVLIILIGPALAWLALVLI